MLPTITVRRVVSPALGANCYIVGSSQSTGCVVVDPGYEIVTGVQDVLAEQGWSIEAVLVTHGHLDHIAGIADLEPDVPVYLHAADRYRLADPFAQLGPELAALVEAQFGGREQWRAPTEVRPFEAVLASPSTLRLAGLTITLHHAPGHTEGATLYQVDGLVEAPEVFQAQADSVLFTGDVLFAGSIGRTDLHGGDHDQMETTLRRVVLGLPDHVVALPGHGPGTTIGAERAGNPFLMPLR